MRQCKSCGKMIMEQFVGTSCVRCDKIEFEAFCEVY